MGIHGIYKEIGPGERTALSKLAVEKFEQTGRPLRIAIDVSIWLFQIQASKGGTNPALRTFYYRLLRLISLSIHPVFVFDGPNKPPFKRNKRTGPNVASIPEFLAKQLLKQFGFPIHRAPGEAEAECALLQREGIVDAVLSEDVDTLMFGSGITIRNWSPEGKKKTPTHVNLYDAVKTKAGAGLDRAGMILVALMSGGDYVPEGIPGCGPKTACEAARAGFGSDLCGIRKGDTAALQNWRDRLQHELKTNESKLFKRKHTTLRIPEDFPRSDILGYYTHPAISTQAGLDELRRSIKWDQELDFPGLRDFTADAFDWVKLEGAKHFIRCFAPSLLVRQLRLRSKEDRGFVSNDVVAIQEDEALLVKSIHGKRKHPETDNSTELRVSFTPIELVKINLDLEEPDDDLPPSSQLGNQAAEEDLDESIAEELEGNESAPKKRAPTKFDPTKPVRVWVMESYVKVGVPLKVQDWEASLVKPKRAAIAKEAGKSAPKTKGAKRSKTTGDLPQASIDQFTKVTKPGMKPRTTAKPSKAGQSSVSSSQLPSAQDSNAVVSLLSSSPVRPSRATFQPLRPLRDSLSPVPEVPPSVTKRKKRGPIQRSKTLPASLEDIDRPSTPPAPDVIETLDLLSSPVVPSPSQLPAKKAKTTSTRDPPVTRLARSKSATASPGVKSKQTTLDAFAIGSPTGTPTKRRNATPPPNATLLPPPQFRTNKDGIEELDLTLSPQIERTVPASSASATNPRRSTTDQDTQRPPLKSITSNTSFSSTSSDLSSRHIAKATIRDRRPQKAKARSPTIEEVDLTGLDSPPLSTLPPPLPKTSLCLAAQTRPSLSNDPSDIPASPPPIQPTTSLRRSPRTHRTSSEPSIPRAQKSPPAAWKQHSQKMQAKKREIRLRDSLRGAWAYVDEMDSPAAKDGATKGKGKGKGKRWRESEVAVLDLT
ncbi:hypothetical protein BDV96DRAFT_519429 [Lophiotrema nucula]|uniref:Flap structure-specific endonuclease n=1 Tax=Lophiotrema nucula TaxID=690887 RepID=A0A6A5Z9U6_9PLEO|nr:hypothetical protein BDV96DRAFT_519429 [Lophiotrema nucula]